MDAASAPEELLVERSRQGDLAAFNALVERYQKLVYNFCLRMLGERQGAEDATQETFLAAYRHIALLRGANFRAWLFRIAANTCRDELRRRRHAPQPLTPAASSVPSPEAYIEQRDLFRHLQAALLTLPPGQRLLLLLCDAYGFSYEEAARITGLRLGTVRSRLSRGRAKLRQLLRRWELLPPQGRL